MTDFMDEVRGKSADDLAPGMLPDEVRNKTPEQLREQLLFC